MTERSDHAPQQPGDEPESPGSARRTSRDVLYEQIGLQLINAGVLTPAAEFIDEVRSAAGFRVSPREIVVAVNEMSQMEQPIGPAAVAELVGSMRGNRSARQQRHAAEWRALGAQLALRDRDGSPRGQRKFIGDVRAAAGPRGSDHLLLLVSLAVAEVSRRLDADTVGRVARRIAPSAADLSDDAITNLAQTELRAVRRLEGLARRSRQAASRDVWRPVVRTKKRKQPGKRRR